MCNFFFLEIAQIMGIQGDLEENMNVENLQKKLPSHNNKKVNSENEKYP